MGELIEHDAALNRILVLLAVAAGAVLLFPAGLLGLAVPLVAAWTLRGDDALPRATAWFATVPVLAWLWWPVRSGWEAAAFAHVGGQLAYLPRLPELDGALLAAWARETLHPGVPLGLLVGLLLVGSGLVKAGARAGAAAAPVATEQHPAPPAIPKAVVARAGKGEVPVATRGWEETARWSRSEARDELRR